MLKIEQLRKTYGDKVALDSVTIEFQCGVYGVLGANGAGKSTLMNLITDNITRESGSILFEGKDILTLGSYYRKQIGYMPQQQGFYDNMSPVAFLMYMARLKGINKSAAKKQIEDLLHTVNLYHEKDKAIGGFSGGMKQRVLLAQALLGEPKILLLDEPTAGLDPKERIQIRNFISSIASERLVILSTHLVGDIECIADKVLIMKQGRIIKQGTPRELIDLVHDKVGEFYGEKEEMLALRTQYPSCNLHQTNRGIALRIVSDQLDESAERVSDITLEDVYMYFVDVLE